MIKYILFEQGNGDCVPVLFPALHNHANTAADMRNLGIPVEAGFVQVDHDGTLVPYGESVSMKLKCTELSEKWFKALNAGQY